MLNYIELKWIGKVVFFFDWYIRTILFLHVNHYISYNMNCELYDSNNYGSDNVHTLIAEKSITLWRL